MAYGNSIPGLIAGFGLSAPASAGSLTSAPVPAWTPGLGAVDASALGAGLGDLAVLIWAPLILITLCSAATLLFLLRPERVAAHTAPVNAHREMKVVRAALQIAQIIGAAPTQVAAAATNPSPTAAATRRRPRRAPARRSVRGRVSGRELAPAAAPA